MELALIITVGVLFAIVGIVCVVSVAIGLPGAWLLVALAALIEVIDPVYLREDDTAGGGEITFGWWLIAGCAGFALVGEGLEFLAGALGAKTGGSSRRGMIGALIGGLIGAIAGIAIPVPIVGSLIGAVIGTFIGAIIGELGTGPDATVRGSLRPATAASIGRIVGTAAKIPVAFAIWVVLVVAALWP